MVFSPPIELLSWTFAGLVLTYLIVGGVRRVRGARNEHLRVADWLTLARFVLIAPTVWLLVHDEFGAAAISYFVLGWTDIVDGMVAA